MLPVLDIHGNNKTYSVGVQGDWTRSLKELPPIIRVEMKNWVVLTPEQTSSYVGPFVQSLQSVISSVDKYALQAPTVLVLI